MNGVYRANSHSIWIMQQEQGNLWLPVNLLSNGTEKPSGLSLQGTTEWPTYPWNLKEKLGGIRLSSLVLEDQIHMEPQLQMFSFWGPAGANLDLRTSLKMGISAVDTTWDMDGKSSKMEYKVGRERTLKLALVPFTIVDGKQEHMFVNLILMATLH